MSATHETMSTGQRLGLQIAGNTLAFMALAAFSAPEVAQAEAPGAHQAAQAHFDASANTAAKITSRDVEEMIKHVGPYHRKYDINITSGRLTRNIFVEHGKCSESNPYKPILKFFKQTRTYLKQKSCSGEHNHVSRYPDSGPDIYAKRLNKIGNTVIDSMPGIAELPHGYTRRAEADNHDFTILLAAPSHPAPGQAAPREIEGHGHYQPHVTDWYAAEPTQ